MNIPLGISKLNSQSQCSTFRSSGKDSLMLNIDGYRTREREGGIRKLIAFRNTFANITGADPDHDLSYINNSVFAHKTTSREQNMLNEQSSEESHL